MAGLLDNIDGDTILSGLLSAGAASGAKGPYLARVAAGLAQGERFKQGRAEQARQRSQDEMQAEYKQLMMRKMQMDAERAQRDDQQGQANNAAVMGSIGGDFDPASFFQKNPGANVAALEQVMKTRQMMQPKASKFSTTPQYDQQGNAFILADDGTMKPLAGVKARDPLKEVRLGDKVGFRTDFSPEITGAIPLGQSPDSAASVAATLRGQNMTDSRARDLNAIGQEANRIKAGEKTAEKDLAKAGQVASFDVMLGSLDRLSKHPGLARSVGVVGAFPTMPGSESANFKAELDTFQSQAFIPMVSQLKGMGALSDAEGKKLTAAVGALSPSMGEKAFRESVARITSDMNAARDRVSGAAKSAAQMEKLPPAQQHKGRTIRDTATGKTLVSNGLSWVEEK